MKKESNYLIKAIQFLRPTAQFSIIENDYENIKWDFLEGDAPTQTEIDAAIDNIKKEEINAEKILAEKKANAEAKLAALGLTSDDLKVLGLA